MNDLMQTDSRTVSTDDVIVDAKSFPIRVSTCCRIVFCKPGKTLQKETLASASWYSTIQLQFIPASDFAFDRLGDSF